MQQPDSSLVIVSIPLPTSLARLYASAGVSTALPIPAELFRQALGIDAADRFSPLDRLIAQVITDHGPVQAAELVRLLEQDHDEITTEGNIRKRFMQEMPLTAAGFRNVRGEGYAAPD